MEQRYDNYQQGPGRNDQYNDERPSYPGNQNSGRGNFQSFDGPEPVQDTIFVSGLPESVNEEQLAQYFGSIGLIKIDKKTRTPKIWIYKDKATGRGKGEATVTYDDPPTANSAIAWFNGKDFESGCTIQVQLAQRRTPNFTRGGGRGGGSFGGAPRGGRGFSSDRGSRGGRGGGFSSDSRGGPPGGDRKDDWMCSCGNNNFAFRSNCNRCQSSKPADAGGDSMGSSGGYGGGRGGRDGGYSGSRGGGREGGFSRGRGGDRDGGYGGGRGGRGGRDGGFSGGRGGDREGGYGGGRGRGGRDSGYSGGRGGSGGGRDGGSGREGDWTCPDQGCGNQNFAWRNNCNRCQTSKPSGTGSNNDNGNSGGGYGGGDSRYRPY